MQQLKTNQLGQHKYFNRFLNKDWDEHNLARALL